MKEVRVNEKELRAVIAECVEAALKEDFDGWRSRNDAAYGQAVEAMAGYVLSEIGEDGGDRSPYYENAIDLQDCSPEEVQWAYAYAQENMDPSVYGSPYSIRQLMKTHLRVPVPNSFEDIVEGGYQDALPEELLQAVYDRTDMAGITDRNALMGGSFESMRDFQKQVLGKVAEHIKQKYADNGSVTLSESQLRDVVKAAIVEGIMAAR